MYSLRHIFTAWGLALESVDSFRASIFEMAWWGGTAKYLLLCCQAPPHMPQTWETASSILILEVFCSCKAHYPAPGFPAPPPGCAQSCLKLEPCCTHGAKFAFDTAAVLCVGIDGHLYVCICSCTTILCLCALAILRSWLVTLSKSAW